MAAPDVLYHHSTQDFYECMGCHEFIEAPYLAVLQQGKPKEPVKTNPENRLRWLELIGFDHGKCAAFKDEAKALEQRQYRQHPLIPHRA